MRAHWDSKTGTRKLNKHYQSSGRITPPTLWSEIILRGLTGNIRAVYAPITLDKDGIWFTSGTSIKGGYDLPQINIDGYSYDIFPLGWVNTNNLTINGYPVPDLANYNFSDSSGKFKCKKTTITIDYSFYGLPYTRNEEVYLIYMDFTDVPTQTISGQLYTVATRYYNVKWDIPFRVPKSTPLTFKTVRNNLNTMYNDGSVYKYDGLGTADLGVTIMYDDDSGYPLTTPSLIGSYVSANVNMVLNQMQYIIANMTDAVGSLTGIVIEDNNNTNSFNIAYETGFDTSLHPVNAVYSNTMFFRGAPSVGGRSVRVHNNEFDVNFLYCGSVIDIQGTGTFNRSEVTRWQ